MILQLLPKLIDGVSRRAYHNTYGILDWALKAYSESDLDFQE